MQLVVRELSYSYSDVPVFQDVGFTLSSGQVLHCLGANGSGKTTLLKCLATLKTPDSGAILIDGVDIEQHQNYPQSIAYLGHLNGLNPNLTLHEHISCSALIPQVSVITLKATIKNLALPDRILDTPIKNLSQGQRRKCAFVQVLLKNALIWILDEPFASVDEKGCELIQSCIEHHTANGGMVILTNHQFSNQDSVTLHLHQGVSA